MLAIIIASISWSGLTAWFTSLALFMGVLTTSALAIGAFAKKTGLAKPIKWAWKQLVGSPVTSFFDKRDEQRSLWLTDTLKAELDPIKADLEHVRAEVTTNGGSSIKDAVKRLESGQTELRTQILKQRK